MNILISATYFYPYRSGLSIYALRLARGLAAMGHKVVVLTSQHDKLLALKEVYQGIVIIRVPVKARLSKGVLMPGLRKTALQWVVWADLVNLHLPQFESGVLATLAHRFRKPIVVSYHCDLEMHGKLFSRLAGWGTNLLAGIALRRSRVIVQNSLDYAYHSKTLRPYLKKVVAIPTPITLKTTSLNAISAFRKKFGFGENQILIGLAGRVAAEKGWEYLAEAMPAVWQQHPNAVVVHSGMWKGVVGEEAYQKRIERMLQSFGERWRILGYLDEEDFNAFFGACDVFVLASLNRTESFGIVQVEALAQGTPVVASDLPGIRIPVIKTGCGALVPPRDAVALAKAINRILNISDEKRCDALDYLDSFKEENVASAYAKLFEKAIKD